MPRSDKRSAYPAVTLLMTVLVIMWFAVYVCRQFIPPGAPNRLYGSHSDFLRAASTQRIPWWPLSSEAFAEARRRDKPIFLVISTAASFAARQADAQSFDNSEVIERLRQDFVCIRVDFSERPEWLSAILPVSRATEGFEPTFQIWIRNFGCSLLHYAKGPPRNSITPT
jgi:hypothetical protein